MRLRIFVPLKVITGTSKQIIGPYRHLAGHYYLALGFNAPDETSVRWELHVLSDPYSILGGWDRGAASILGYKTLVKYEGDPKPLKRALTHAGARGTLHLAPWGIPLLIVADVGPLNEKTKALMHMFGLSGARRFLDSLAEDTEIIEQ